MALGDKYLPLATHLERTDAQLREVQMTFQEVESVLRFALPRSAREYREWWSNDGRQSQSAAWMGAGWKVGTADLYNELVTFRRGGAPRIARSSLPRARVSSVRESTSATHAPEAENPASGGVVLVACASTKLPYPAPARDLYISSLFLKSRAYAERGGSKWYILSAKHGLLLPDQIVEPYDLTLRDLTRGERQAWAQRVADAIRPKLQPGQRVIFLAGRHYRADLQRILKQRGHPSVTPMQGLGIGRQLAWLSRR